jgi:hypothetical protein
MPERTATFVARLVDPRTALVQLMSVFLPTPAGLTPSFHLRHPLTPYTWYPTPEQAAGV